MFSCVSGQRKCEFWHVSSAWHVVTWTFGCLMRCPMKAKYAMTVSPDHLPIFTRYVWLRKCQSWPISALFDDSVGPLVTTSLTYLTICFIVLITLEQSCVGKVNNFKPKSVIYINDYLCCKFYIYIILLQVNNGKFILNQMRSEGHQIPLYRARIMLLGHAGAGKL